MGIMDSVGKVVYSIWSRPDKEIRKKFAELIDLLEKGDIKDVRSRILSERNGGGIVSQLIELKNGLEDWKNTNNGWVPKFFRESTMLDVARKAVESIIRDISTAEVTSSGIMKHFGTKENLLNFLQRLKYLLY